MIEVKGLVKLYGDRKVLHGLDFSVGVGRVCGFLGPNGSGKSTTMDILSGLLGPSDGDVKICGFDVVTQSTDVKANVGYLPDNPPLHREMLVRDFIDYAAKLRKISATARKAAVDQVIEDCDLTDVTNRIIGNLSKGYRQRVALSSALVHKPQVLILDEPTEGLDPNQIVLIRNLIKKLAKDRTVIMSSHILSEIQATCQDVVIINQGRIAAKSDLSEESNHNPSYAFKFTETTDALLTWFKDKSFVDSVTSQEDNTLVVNFREEFWKTSSKENIAKVNQQLVGQGFGVVGIKEHRSGLEAVFFDVIRSQNQPHI